MQAVRLAPGIDPYDVLETGNVLILTEPPLDLSLEERQLILSVRQNGRHKNISYKPKHDRVTGLEKVPPAIAARLHAILRRYSESAVAFAARLLPRYSGRWTLDYASLRAVEEAGRKLPFKQRNDLLHTDAFPTRPTHGGLILRVFWNVHPVRPRVWWIAESFATLAARYAALAGLARIRAQRPTVIAALRHLGVPFRDRSSYDDFMLAFHDYLKNNADFQSNSPKCRLEFPPGAAWMAFTDVVPHAVESGQFALEQTLVVPPGALSAPERAPAAILEKLAGRPLV